MTKTLKIMARLNGIKTQKIDRFTKFGNRIRQRLASLKLTKRDQLKAMVLK